MPRFFMPTNMTAQHIIDTPLGWFVLQGDSEAIQSAKWMDEEDITVGQGSAHADWKRQAEVEIKEYFNGDRQQFTLPLAPQGTAFQNHVWELLRQIPIGATQTYASLGTPEQARAIGAAVGANPVLLLIPCHRVIGSDGSLTGYAGGVERKDELLRMEGAHHPQQLRLFA